MVSTNMTFNMAVNCFVKSASEFARGALNTVGHSLYTSGCLSHTLQVRGMRLQWLTNLQLQYLNVSLFSFLSSYRTLLSRYSCRTGFVCHHSSSQSYEPSQKGAIIKEECARKKNGSVKKKSKHWITDMKLHMEPKSVYTVICQSCISKNSETLNFVQATYEPYTLSSL